MSISRTWKGLVATVAVGAVVSMSAAASARADDSDLTVFDWAGYEAPEFHPAYVEKYGHSPTFAFFADEDEAFAKLMSGFKADIAHPCSQSVAKWRDAGLLQPIDPKRVKGYDDIMPGFKDMKNLMTGPEGKTWFIPFDWGNTALTYRTDKVDAADVQSLQAFADPKFKGRVSIGDNVDDAYALASLAIGLKDWTGMTDEQFQKASDFLRKVHKNVRLYWTDGTELAQAMAGGEVDLAWAWNETATTLKAEDVPVTMKKDTKEGLSTWVCGYVRLKDAPGSEQKAYDYLSAVNDPKVSKYLVTDWGYGHGNAAGMKAISQKELEASGYGDIDKFVGNTLFQSPVSPELKQKMIAEFEKIKAGY
ncbi:ABC transporter substrate-binding protein [Pararhizobium mangrovi]|uniref:ABC transporter substrate-binding protein n=1 Tax=Pararhizobium mangrovi TaxID=2590452 RepID=A0A506U4G8_9HYPH|nr:ABC transporter substrate-binding protein [Pararhizobium mangrovi]TPW27439.1 ABC transporter substrate-binding protein [Pararhizobium mangrovi]